MDLPLAKRLPGIRRNLRLTQRQAAKLLNISKNTWIRWERGQCAPDRLALELLPVLAQKAVPKPCHVSRAKGFAPEWLAQHIHGCPDCRLSVKYVVTVGQL